MRPRAGARPPAPARRPLKPHGIDSVMTSGHSVTEQLLLTSRPAPNPQRIDADLPCLC